MNIFSRPLEFFDAVPSIVGPSIVGPVAVRPVIVRPVA